MKISVTCYWEMDLTSIIKTMEEHRTTTGTIEFQTKVKESLYSSDPLDPGEEPCHVQLPAMTSTLLAY
jgi:hypothetical protein